MKSTSDAQTLYRAIPSVQELLLEPAFQEFPIEAVFLKQIIRQETERLRRRFSGASGHTPEEVPQQLREAVIARLEKITRPRLKRVINAAGIILHTNMGRAPLAPEAREHLIRTTENYNNLELDLASGKRGSRTDLVEELICLVTGAEAAMMVNNCAAAILLTLNTLCRGKQTPVSRGELVEIGGSFRMPEVMKSSGARMVEVGATNKTHLHDYREAITEKTGALLKVHTSNYRILGFSGGVELADLVELAHQHQLPLIYDMGSGVLVDLQTWGYPPEPLVGEVLELGVDVITFSGDKILGGPQAGIIAGKKSIIDKIKKNHLSRALRCDKLIFAAMEATLRLYLEPQKLPERLPLATMLTLSQDTLRSRAESVKERVINHHLTIEVIETYSQVGSGALPLEKIPSTALQVASKKYSPNQIARRMRERELPIVGYVQDEKYRLNLRTVREDELDELVVALNQLS